MENGSLTDITVFPEQLTCSFRREPNGFFFCGAFNAEFAVARARRRRPSTCGNAVGIFCREKPLEKGIPSEDTGFLWFFSEEELVTFLSTHLIPFFGPISLRQKISAQNLMAQYRRQEIDRALCLRELNQLLCGHTEVQWWGSYTDLVSGLPPAESFPRIIRSRFHGRLDSLISERAQRRFDSFLHSYKGED